MKLRKKRERGQVIVIFVIALASMLLLLTLVLDGGFLLLRRREAQVAADAGALAGVIYLCGESPSSSIATSTAIDYASVQNSASSANVTFPNATRIRVTATIDQAPSFAGMFGWGNISVQAVAAAECRPAGASTGVLPIAWSCRPNVEGIPSDSDDCAMRFGDENIYILMDSNPTNEALHCIDPPNSQGTPEYESGDMDCDLDDDGIDDIIDSGNRGWLDLDGGNNSVADAIDWIMNGFDGEIATHTWVPGQPGTRGSEFQAVNDLGPPYPIVIIPLYNEFCNNTINIEVDCADKIHYPPDPEDIIIEENGSSSYYHVYSFALFQITCVYSMGSDPQCPGRQLIGFISPSDPKTIEGYFIEGYSPNLGSGLGGDTGAYIIRLYQ